MLGQEVGRLESGMALQGPHFLFLTCGTSPGSLSISNKTLLLPLSLTTFINTDNVPGVRRVLKH